MKLSLALLASVLSLFYALSLLLFPRPVSPDFLVAVLFSAGLAYAALRNPQPRPVAIKIKARD